MKSLLIYYSYTGNGELVAELFASHGMDTRKVEPKKKLPKSFFWGVMTGGFLAGIKYKDKLVNFNSDISEYDHIYIASPVWNARFSSPINGVLHQLDLSNKEVTFILYSGSGEAPKAVKRIAKEYPSAQYFILKEPKKYKDELKKLEMLF